MLLITKQLVVVALVLVDVTARCLSIPLFYLVSLWILESERQIEAIANAICNALLLTLAQGWDQKPRAIKRPPFGWIAW